MVLEQSNTLYGNPPTWTPLPMLRELPTLGKQPTTMEMGTEENMTQHPQRAFEWQAFPFMTDAILPPQEDIMTPGGERLEWTDVSTCICRAIRIDVGLGIVHRLMRVKAQN